MYICNFLKLIHYFKKYKYNWAYSLMNVVSAEDFEANVDVQQWPSLVFSEHSFVLGPNFQVGLRDLFLSLKFIITT